MYLREFTQWPFSAKSPLDQLHDQLTTIPDSFFTTTPSLPEIDAFISYKMTNLDHYTSTLFGPYNKPMQVLNWLGLL